MRRAAAAAAAAGAVHRSVGAHQLRVPHEAEVRGDLDAELGKRAAVPASCHIIRIGIGIHSWPFSVNPDICCDRDNRVMEVVLREAQLEQHLAERRRHPPALRPLTAADAAAAAAGVASTDGLPVLCGAGEACLSAGRSGAAESVLGPPAADGMDRNIGES
eukprot:SAG25_NODE_1280_length_3419_cov_44.074096_4_plen_161_part_00